jgi:hypothetical protein
MFVCSDLRASAMKSRKRWRTDHMRIGHRLHHVASWGIRSILITSLRAGGPYQSKRNCYLLLSTSILMGVHVGSTALRNCSETPSVHPPTSQGSLSLPLRVRLPISPEPVSKESAQQIMRHSSGIAQVRPLPGRANCHRVFP